LLETGGNYFPILVRNVGISFYKISKGVQFHLLQKLVFFATAERVLWLCRQILSGYVAALQSDNNAGR
jgi:hypothetical protein